MLVAPARCFSTERGRSLVRSASARRKLSRFSNALCASHALRPGTSRAPAVGNTLKWLAEIVHVHAAAFDDVFERADGDGLAAVLGDDGLSSVRVTPFLVAAALAHEEKAVPSEHPDDLMGVADWEVPAQGRASSTSLACLRSFTGAGSNQRDSASLALVIASASVSPAVAQPGNSGNTADQRFVCESNSTSNRNFMGGE